ncbi:MAG: histidine kinase [Pseudomonadota bacterium]|nr:histidine kinase [Pseudomonadota bacterium]
MTIDKSEDTKSAGAATPQQGSVPPRRSRWNAAVAWTRNATAEAGRASFPTIKGTATRLGDWLARVSWRRFFLVALLLLIVGGIAQSVFFVSEPVVVVKVGDLDDRVQINLQVAADGVRISAPESKPPVKKSKFKKSKSKNSDDANVKIDEKGLRITASDDGEQVSVVIDDKGVRVERRPAATDADASDTSNSDSGVTIENDGRTLKIGPEFTQDPQKLALALDKARERIEDIVEQQIDRQIARETRRYREETGDWLMGFVMLLILAGITVKVVLGGKKRAEYRAQAATENAAEESLKRQLAEAQLKTMQAQIEPHFLFNTLASVDYLIETAPATASKMQKSLIQYLRAALPQMREGSTTLGKEVQLCRSYLEILKFRMEDRLHYSVIVPQGLGSAQFPPMMLQSLVENAIKHGLEPKPQGGSLTISADISNGRLRVTVADSGLGFEATGASSARGTGVGLTNVRERLAVLYGGAARLSIEANSPSGTIVTIEVPYTFEANAPGEA